MLLSYNDWTKAIDELQLDLDRMSNWTNTWQLFFNPDKCEVMRITHRKDFSIPEYYLSGKKLNVVNRFKDLGSVVRSPFSLNGG